MGCDIHLFAEKRVDGRWLSADRWTKCPWANPSEERMHVAHEDCFYGDRNYLLFSLLAGVRGEDGAIPFAEPRGLPDDISPQVAAEYEDGGGHSSSHWTVAELLAQDWTANVTETRSVALGEFIRWDESERKYGERPRAWCGWTSGTTIAEAEVPALIKAMGRNPAEDDERVHVRTSWTVPRSRICREFLSNCMPRLWRLGKPEDVRIVFWFDS